MLTGTIWSQPLAHLAADMERLFDATLSGTPAVRQRGWPALNTWEDAEAFYVEAEVPGLTKEQVDISVTGDEVTIKGTRPANAPQGAAFVRRERWAGQFERTLVLGSQVDAEKASKVGDKVVQWLIEVRSLDDDEFKAQRTELEKKARQIVGDPHPLDVMRRAMEMTLAELLSNPRLEAAIAARLKAAK